MYRTSEWIIIVIVILLHMSRTPDLSVLLILCNAMYLLNRTQFSFPFCDVSGGFDTFSFFFFILYVFEIFIFFFFGGK